MKDELIAKLPEAERASAKSYLDRLVDLETIDKDGFAKLLKESKAFKSLYESELSRKNEEYRQRVQSELIPESIKEAKAKWEAEAFPESDPEKIKALIETEKDPAEAKLLKLRYDNAVLANQMKSLQRDSEAKKHLEMKIELSKKLKGVIDEKGYPLDPDVFVDLGDKALEVITKIGDHYKAKETEIVEKYKGTGNKAPMPGSVSTQGLTVGEAMMRKSRG